ncbi:MAG TPA: glutathione S-transferase family protein [Pseudolabrys sp.]|nr:glutathione S-transferase family protein [Pseudolabrys sp.]
MLELYNFAQSTCSLKVRICLHEKGLAWTDHRLISKNADHLSEWYLKLNPNGVVPTLIHDGRPVFESSVILQYLDQVFPDVALMPADAYGQAQVRAWLAFVDAVPTPAVRYPSFQFGGLLHKFQAMTQEQFDAQVTRRPLKGAFYRKMDRMTGFGAAEMKEAYAALRKTAARMDRMFDQHGGPWLMGTQYGLADIAVAPLIDRAEDLGLEALWCEDTPRVDDWLERMKARPAYGKAYYEGSRLSQQYPELKLGRGSNRDAIAQTGTANAAAE